MFVANLPSWWIKGSPLIDFFFKIESYDRAIVFIVSHD